MSRKSVAGAIFYSLYGVVFIGWLLHTPPLPSLGKYNGPYVAFLLVASAGFLVPTLVSRVRERLGQRDSRFALLAFLGALLVVHAVAAQVYYAHRRHDFDPFLQISGPTLEEVPFAKPEGTFRVIALGGSTTRCGNLRHEERYPRVLQDLLGPRFGERKVQVLSAGMDWWTTKHSLIRYVTYLRRFDADLLIVMHAVNDAYRSFSPPRFAVGPYRDSWSHYYGPAIRGARPASFQAWFLRRLTRWWYSDLRVRPHDLPVEAFRSLPMFRIYLTDLVRYAQSDGRRVLLVTQPSLYKPEMSEAEQDVLWMGRTSFEQSEGYFDRRYPSARSLERALAAFNSVTLEVADERQALGVDAASMVPKDLDHFVDDVHYTPRGARVLAGLVAEAVIDFDNLGAAASARAVDDGLPD